MPRNVGYDSFMQPFGTAAGGKRKPALKPGDRMPDGRIFGAGGGAMADLHKKQIAELEKQKAEIEAKINKLQQKIDVLLMKQSAKDLAEEPSPPKAKSTRKRKDASPRKKVDVDSADSE